MFTNEEIATAAAAQCEPQVPGFDLAITDPLWIQMYVANLREASAMESVEIRQCWAYNKDGQRCDHPAGHPGNHVVMKEWGDDECYSPIVHQLPKTNPVQEHLNPPLSTVTAAPEPAQPAACVGCNHHHKTGPCKCGCYEFIG